MKDFYIFEKLGTKHEENQTSRRVQVFKKPLLQPNEEGTIGTKLK